MQPSSPSSSLQSSAGALPRLHPVAWWAAAAALLLAALSGAATVNACGELPLELHIEGAVLTLAPDSPPLDDYQLGALRARGPEAVDALIERLTADGHLGGPGEESDPAALALLDRVCGQHDCLSARLFWHTDFEAALAAAASEGKPILSLRLLGRLDEEMSCANSRFFRTLYYADSEIAEFLRSEFVLHWRSMRPVPKVTVEFDDGRRLERTLVGNSIHYVLDSRGRLLDGLPGLYAPTAFKRELEKLGREARAVALLEEDEFIERRAGWIDRVDRSVERLRVQQAPEPSPAEGVFPVQLDLRDVRTMTKSAAVNPVLDSLRPPSRPRGPWTGLAYHFRQDAKLSDETRLRVVRLQNQALFGDADLDDPLARDFAENLITTLQGDLETDTALNHLFLRPVLHQGIVLLSRADPPDESFDDWVYTNVFGDPGDEPWFGLAPKNAFVALSDGGRKGR